MSVWLIFIPAIASTATCLACKAGVSDPRPSQAAPRVSASPEATTQKQAPPLGTAPRLEADQSARWSEPQILATGGGHRGPWRMNASLFHYVDDPHVVLDRRGTAGAVWVNNEVQNVFFQRYDAQGVPEFSEPVNVSQSSGTFSWLPRLILDDPQVFVLWQEIVFSGGTHGGDIFFTRSSDGGKRFAQPINLSDSREGDGKGRLTTQRWHNGSLDLIRDRKGALLATWTTYEGSLYVARSTDGGVTFTRARQVAGTSALPARGPSLAVAADGDIYLAWTVGEDPAADIRVARSRDGGVSFESERIVFASSGHSDAPSIAVGPDGAVHVVYAESPGGPFQQYHLNHIRLDADGSSSAPSALPMLGDQGQREGGVSAHYPSLEVDLQGRLFVVWEHHPSSRAPADGLGFSYSLDSGITFAAPRLLPGFDTPRAGNNGGLQGLLRDKLAIAPSPPDTTTALAVSISRFVPGESSDVRLVRGTWQ